MCRELIVELKHKFGRADNAYMNAQNERMKQALRQNQNSPSSSYIDSKNWQKNKNCVEKKIIVFLNCSVLFHTK
jgi:hypothetical protein